MGRRVLLVSGSGPEAGDEIAALDPAIELEHAPSMDAAVGRLSDGGYDLIVSDEEIGGARTGLFLRHLCQRRFPSIPFVLRSASAVGWLERLKRLL